MLRCILLAVQVPEAVCQALVLVTSLCGGHWFSAALNAVILVLVLRRFLSGKAYLEPLELWKQLKDAQKAAYWKIGSYAGLFAMSMFRCVLLPQPRCLCCGIVQDLNAHNWPPFAGPRHWYQCT